MLEQRVVEAKQRLEKLQAKQRELFAAGRVASLRILSHSNAVIWEKAKQRYRHKVDANGMRTVLMIGALFATLVLPFAFFVAIFDAFVLGTLASVAAVVGILIAYRIVLCGTDEGTRCRIQKHEEEKAKASQMKEDLRVAQEANRYDMQIVLEQLADLEPELARQRAVEEEERRRNEFTNLSKILLNERWKELRSVDFEKYVERVFQHLGYQTEETPVTGDQGVDLVVIAENQRMAVQVKGYYNSVSNSAVQEVVAGMKFHRCNRTCVVTNSRFTSSAVQLAEANHCQCIDENNFQDFVYGRIFPRVRSLASQEIRNAVALSSTSNMSTPG